MSSCFLPRMLVVLVFSSFSFFLFFGFNAEWLELFLPSEKVKREPKIRSESSFGSLGRGRGLPFTFFLPFFSLAVTESGLSCCFLTRRPSKNPKQGRNRSLV